MPVGFKNRTDGNVQVAVDAVRAAAARHAFAGIDADGRSAILHTRGNSDCHIILRGGKSGPNFDAESVAGANALLRASNLPERVVIDVSHDNSQKQPERQPEITRAVGEQVAAGDRTITGVMIESFLVEGNQPPGPAETLTYGQSITDGCIGWDTTVEVLDDLAAAVRARRSTTN
jgi:3-deoxy-7-phosphoheptulonate synthase